MIETLSNEQRKAFDAAVAGENIFISGPGGTGKSYLVHALVEHLREDLGRQVAVASSTGISALAVGGSTIHSLLCTGLSGSVEMLKANNYADMATRCYRTLGNVKTIIIDEVSMLSGDYIDMMDWHLRNVTRFDGPFGGKQVIMVGDLLQLPPVEKRGEQNHRYRFAFQCPAWVDGRFTLHDLTHSFRQSDAVMVAALNSIRFGEFDAEKAAVFEPCVGRELEDPLRLFPTNRQVDSINLRKLAALEGELATSVATLSGPDWAQAKLRKDSIVPETLHLKRGAPVLICKNGDTYVNGQRGIVRDWAPGEVLLDVEGVEKTLRKVEIELIQGGRPKARMVQFPLRLAYGITIHKSQGMTLSNIEIDLKKVFAAGMTYVALSRCRDIETLSLTSPLEPHMVRAEALLVDFYRRNHS